MADENLTIRLIVQKSNAEKNLRNFQGDVRGMGNQVQRSSRQSTSAMASMKSSAQSYLGMAGVAGIAAGAGITVTQAFNRMRNKGSEFEQQLANLEAITGITGDALDELGQSALDSSVEYGEAASNIVEAQKLVASQLAEKIDFQTEEGLKQLKEVSEQAIILQKAAGIDLRTAVQATTQILNQFDQDVSRTSEIVNMLAAGAQKGAGEVDFLAQAMEEAGIGAAGANEKISTTIAALEILAKNGIDAAKSGTGLRNVFTILQGETQKLADAGIKNLNIEQEGLIESLRKSKPLLNDATALNKVFGREVANIARALLNNVDSLEEMRSKITDTNTATEQAKVQLETYEGASARLTETINKELITAFQESNGVMVETINLTRRLVTATGDVVRMLNDYVETETEVADQLGGINYVWQQHFGIFADATNAMGLTESEEKVRKWISTQQEATKATENQVRLLKEDIRFYREQAQAAEDGSVAQESYYRQLGNTAAELGQLRGKLESQKAQLEQQMQSVEKGSTEYERYDFALGKVEERIGMVSEAQEMLKQSTEEETESQNNNAESTQKLAGDKETYAEAIKHLKGQNEEIINQADELSQADIEEMQRNQKKIRQYEQMLQKREKLMNYQPADVATNFRVGEVESADIESMMPSEEIGSEQLKLPKVDTVEYEVALTRAAELRKQLTQENQRAANAETAAERHAAQQSIQSIRQQIRWEEQKAQIVAGSTAKIAGSLADLMQQVGASAEAVKAAALIEVAANSAKAVSAAVAQASQVPFPANIPAIASAVAAVMSGVTQAYALLNQSPDSSGSGNQQERGSGRQRAGFASGGQVPVAVSNGEYQVSPANASRHAELLHNINADPKVAKDLATTAAAQSAATGGMIRGAGSGTSDSIHKDVEPGSYIVNAKSTEAAKPLLDAIEKGERNDYQYGGIVTHNNNAEYEIQKRNSKTVISQSPNTQSTYTYYNQGGPVTNVKRSEYRPLATYIEHKRVTGGAVPGGSGSSQMYIQQVDNQSEVVQAIKEQTKRLEQVERRVQLSLDELDYRQSLNNQNEQLQ